MGRGVDLVIRVTIPEAKNVEEATKAILSGDGRIVVDKDDARISGTVWSYGFEKAEQATQGE